MRQKSIASPAGVLVCAHKKHSSIILVCAEEHGHRFCCSRSFCCLTPSSGRLPFSTAMLSLCVKLRAAAVRCVTLRTSAERQWSFTRGFIQTSGLSGLGTGKYGDLGSTSKVQNCSFLTGKYRETVTQQSVC